jgi:hypothetical protein
MTEYIYLNSVYSEFDEISKYHRFNLVKPIIANDKNIAIRLSEAEIPISYYNVITGYNDKVFFKMTITNDEVISYDLTLPEQNYKISSLVNKINELLLANDKDAVTTLSISYNPDTLKLSLTGKYTGTAPVTILNIQVFSGTAIRLLGMTVGLSTGVTNLTTSVLNFNNAVNLNRTKNIYFFTNIFNTENTVNDYSQGNSILAKVQANLQFNEIVSYQNESDGFINLPQSVSYIDHINLKLLDDDWKFLDFNRLNFCLSLVIQYSNKKVVTFESDNRTQENEILDMLSNDLCEYL